MTNKTPRDRKAYSKAYYEANKDKRKAYYEANKDSRKAYREANKDKVKARNYFKNYPAATQADYQRYLDTCRCESCGVKLEASGKQKKCQDHDHATGKLRGVICNTCNTCEGMIRDLAHLEALKSYIERRCKAQGGE